PRCSRRLTGDLASPASSSTLDAKRGQSVDAALLLSPSIRERRNSRFMPTEPFPVPAFREWRRMQAQRLKQLGWMQGHIGAALSASESVGSAWLAATA